MQVKNIKSAIIAKSAKTIKITKNTSKTQINITFTSAKIHKNKGTKKVDYLDWEFSFVAVC